MNKVTVGAIVVILALFGGLVFWTMNNGKEDKYAKYDATEIIDSTDETGIGEHVRGKVDSKVVLVEYADLQCPGCASMMPRVTELYEKYGDRVAFVFRNFPISGHQNARSAAAAVEAAGLQDHYWEMLEATFAARADWMYKTGSERNDVYVKIFMETCPDGDVEKFKTDMNDERVEKKINFDQSIGREKAKVSATPAFYINGKNVAVSEEDTLDDFKNRIEDEIKAQLKEHGIDE